MPKTDGGPAYPIWTPDMPVEGSPGLSKLEAFAMAAMQGDWGNPTEGRWQNNVDDDLLERRARLYYRMARAMIEAGEEQDHG